MLSIKSSLLLVTALFGAAIGAQNTLMDVFQNTPELSIFNTFVNSPANARLADLFSNSNVNFTILAPVNDAIDHFRQFLAASNVTLTDTQIRNGLYFHIIPDQIIMSRDLNDGFQQYPTLYNRLTMSKTTRPITMAASYDAPQDLTNGVIIYGKGGKFVIFRGIESHAHFIRSDIQASNGVVHTIDGILSPPLSIWRTLQWRGLTKVMDAIRFANAQDAFQLFTNVTFLVPTNAAMEQFMAAHPDITPDALRNILLTHVISGDYFSPDLKTRPSFRVLTKSGEMLQIYNNPDRGVTVGDAVVVKPDILVDSGVLQVIDKVLTRGGVTKTPEQK